ncbi:hypothetical protein AO262_17655 [Pseudomonas fluorescens ABAC62]|nr:hypothetical protein AO262_17655 [Pseudomonas fluorescens ABAC62]
MKTNFYELQQFLAGYFHQDWVDEYKCADDVIAIFKSESSAKTTTKVIQEIRILLTLKKTEKQLQNFLFYDIGCNYYHPHEWTDGTSWLEHICLSLSGEDKHN